MLVLGRYILVVYRPGEFGKIRLVKVCKMVVYYVTRDFLKNKKNINTTV